MQNRVSETTSYVRKIVTLLFHIASASEIESAAREGEYIPARFAADGFVHCSYAHQIRGVADAKYRGHKNLVLLVIDLAQLTCPVVDENLVGGKQLYPHVYGRLSMSAVIATHLLSPDENGFLRFPCDVVV